MRTQIRTDLAALVAAILASKGVEVQEVWVDALADVRLDARGWATLDRLGREHKQLKYFNGTASLGAMGRFALGYQSFSDFTAFMSDDFALEPAMREIPLRIGLLQIFLDCALFCVQQNLWSFSQISGAQRFKVCKTKVSEVTRVTLPPKKRGGFGRYLG